MNWDIKLSSSHRIIIELKYKNILYKIDLSDFPILKSLFLYGKKTLNKLYNGCNYINKL